MVLAGVVRGFAGFGAAMIMMPVLAAVLGPVVAVLTLAVMDSLMTLPLVARNVRHCDWRSVGLLAAATAAAMPLGVWALVVIDPVYIRWALSGFIAAAVAVMASGWRFRGRASAGVTLAAGGTGGFLSGAIGMAGPVIVTFWLAGQSDAAAARRNIIVYFGVSGVVSLAIFLTGGLMTGQVWLLIAILAPIYGLSLWLGARLFGRASEQAFRRFALGLIALVAASSLVI